MSKTTVERLATLETEIKQIKNTVNKIDDNIDKKLVTKNEFLPVKTIAYGMLGIIITAVLTAMVGQVIINAFF